MKSFAKLAVGISLFSLLPALAAAQNLIAYDDIFENGFQDYSWAPPALYNPAETAVVHSGADAISFAAANFEAVYFYLPAGIDTASYSGLDLWVNGGAIGGQSVSLSLVNQAGASIGTPQPLSSYTGGTIPANTWVEVQASFASLGVTSGVFYGFWFQDTTGLPEGAPQPTMYLDDISLTAIPTGPVSVAVDPTANRLAISQLIYGVNFGDPAQAAYMHWPVQRWGGNSTTRYNWMTDVENLASDWYYENYPQPTPTPGTLPNGSTADIFIDDARAAGAQPLITLGNIGWTPKETTQPAGPVNWGFSVGKYGAQCSVDPFYPDAGNGVLPDCLTDIAGNDPLDTSTAVDQSWATAWMAHIESRVGTAGQGGVKFFALDNEPMLWNSTHRDVHPSPTTYDEMWSKAQAWASAAKVQDPNAQILGTSEWGWCGYFWSALDGCANGTDYANHGNTYFTDWYLQQMHAYDTANGVRLLDYLDLHYYPQSTNVALTDDESAATSALRLRSLKSLYDPTYVDESWIGLAGFQGGIIRMIPRMHDWVNNNYPGTKLAISEYNWGGVNDTGESSALAQAEALAIFGREGLDLATRWVAPVPGSFVEDAFKLYLNYDGIGSQVTGTSVQATSSSVDSVGSYAIENVSNRLFILLFDKNTAATDVSIGSPIGFAQPAHMFGFDTVNRLTDFGIVNPSGGAFAMTLPARSARMLIEQLDFFDVPPSSPFYSFIMKLANDSITAGCGAGDYCPSANILRNQMAVFVLRSIHGPTYVAPAANCGTYPFSDVTCPNAFANYILEAYNEGIMGVGEDTACGAGMFCPSDPVTRLSMAYVLLRGQHGAAYVPPSANCGTFPFVDVACPSPDADWVSQLLAEGITAGCDATHYCPAAALNRAQMAVFLTTTFALP